MDVTGGEGDRVLSDCDVARNPRFIDSRFWQKKKQKKKKGKIKVFYVGINISIS